MKFIHAQVERLQPLRVCGAGRLSEILGLPGEQQQSSLLGIPAGEAE